MYYYVMIKFEFPVPQGFTSSMTGQDRGMNRGMSLVELMLSLTIGTMVILVVCTMYALFSKCYGETKEAWYCLQSLRSAFVQIDSDVKQCSFLLPQDLKLAWDGGTLFIAGAPATSAYSGVSLNGGAPPPYYSIVQTSLGPAVGLDSVDIDEDGTPDYRADLGVITDSGPCVISHGYSRGNATLSMASSHRIRPGDRSVPSNHYQLREDGLYRNAQLLAEAITAFDAHVAGNELTIHLLARHNGKQKDLTYTYRLQ